MAEIPATDVRTHFVDWTPILAGAVTASAISFVLFAAGTAIGLSLLSPYPSRSYGTWAATVSAFWAIFVPIVSLLVGGYLAGRMRVTWNTSQDEVQFRDGVHGLLVWATAVVIGAILAFLVAGAATQASGEIAAATISNRNTLVSSSVDSLLRPAPGTSLAQISGPTTPNDREELTKLLVTSTADGSLDSEDRDYLAGVVANRTGLAPDAALKRVEAAYAQALAKIEAARKSAVAAGLATATALLLGLAAAWYAAQRGGHHRDQNIPARFIFVGLRKST
jgi:hypothetical protein